MIQLTGKDQYSVFTKNHNRMNREDIRDFVTNPDLIISNIEYGVESAFSFWIGKKLLNNVEDKSVFQVTQVVNGGQNGYQDRLNRFNSVAPFLGVNKE